MKNRLTILLAVMIAGLMTGCIQTTSRAGEEGAASEVVNLGTNANGQIISLLGDVLPEKQLAAWLKEKRMRELAAAQKKYEADPENVDNIIWYGRRLAYLGDYLEAIRIYSIGIDKYPDSYRLLRHRGHRYITIRQFDKAIEDLQKAAFYARPMANEIEPDGLPNRLNKPLTNDKFNIWYHLGIAYYLKGNFDKAISSFKQCMVFSDNDDLKVATTDWFYMTYRKIGNTAAAEALLEPITRNMTIIENMSYHQRLMLYKGVYTEEGLLDNASRSNNSLDPTLAYGVGNWLLVNGKVNDAQEIFERIMLHPGWDSFAYIAAEVDLRALRNL